MKSAPQNRHDVESTTGQEHKSYDLTAFSLASIRYSQAPMQPFRFATVSRLTVSRIASVYDRYQNFSECKHARKPSHTEPAALSKFRFDRIREVRDVSNYPQQDARVFVSTCFHGKWWFKCIP